MPRPVRRGQSSVENGGGGATAQRRWQMVAVGLEGQIQWDPHGVGLLTMRLGLLSFGWQLKHVVGGMGSPGCGSGPHLISIQRHGEALMVEASRSLPEVVLPLFDGPTNPRAETYCMLRPFESR
ncbi:hypothetical protein CRG98_009385 [Punica granatum]|uniref:Uncharacterized protein n=1 Tax=Punica granatum TaxID=22663 RepID=A0A2I0KPH1_PUNGR|nr:hypothetical protein CRG98_009385 [Punica granatum]